MLITLTTIDPVSFMPVVDKYDAAHVMSWNYTTKSMTTLWIDDPSLLSIGEHKMDEVASWLNENCPGAELHETLASEIKIVVRPRDTTQAALIKLWWA